MDYGLWTMDYGPLTTRLKAEALRYGFSLSGIAPATEADGFMRDINNGSKKGMPGRWITSTGSAHRDNIPLRSSKVCARC